MCPELQGQKDYLNCWNLILNHCGFDHITEEALLLIVQGHATQAFFTSESLEKTAFVGQVDYTLGFWAMGLNTMVSHITASHIST